ncbi:hypothetical protein COY07_03910, partial [Candidatus Peregrinibacteria bacterium CG_4_10_14_0_2_um_filter_43_11]
MIHLSHHYRNTANDWFKQNRTVYEETAQAPEATTVPEASDAPAPADTVTPNKQFEKKRQEALAKVDEFLALFPNSNALHD